MRNSILMASSVALVALSLVGEARAQERYKLVVDLNGTFCRSFNDAKASVHADLVRYGVVRASKISAKVDVGHCFFAAFTISPDEIGDGGEHLVDGVSFRFFTFPLNKMMVWGWKQTPAEAI